MIKHLTLIYFIVMSLTLQAQNSVTGLVLDKDTKEPLIGVTILVVGTNTGTVSDLEGKFVLSNIPSKAFELEISYISYQKLNINVDPTQQTDLGQILMESTAIGLDEVEVSSSFINDRKTPVAVSTISSQQLLERFSGLEAPEVFANTPGIYSNQGAGGYGDQEVYIRGFDQTNIAFMINGIPVNDMENGRMFWSNFAGISEATRAMQVQRGLGASKLAISSIGGTVNMISKPAERVAGGQFDYQLANATWNSRARFTYNTGELDGGWAVTFQGSRTTTNGGLLGMSGSEQGGIRPGAYVDAWAYYLAVSKKINDRHQLLFYGFGAPFRRGSAWYLSDELKSSGGYTNDKIHFNYATGYKNGEFFNARQNNVHKPQFSLSHYWDIDQTTSLSTSVYVSIARAESVQPRVTSGFNKTTPAVRDADIRTTEGFLDFEFLIGENQDPSNTVTINQPNGDPFADPFTGQAAVNFLEKRHNNHVWYGVISNLNKQFGKVNLLAGVDLRNYKGSHFVTAHDLLGADFIRNTDRGEYDTSAEYEMDLLRPNAVIQTGDKFMYNYDGHILWGSAFAQAEANLNKLDVFFTLSGTQTQYYRVGHNWNEEFKFSSLGRSEKKNFFSYIIKTGVNYRISNRHNVYVNGGHFTRPPYMRNSFQDSRFTNDYNLGLQKEKVYAGEAGYSFRTGHLKLNLNAYYTFWQDRTINASATGQLDDPQDQQSVSENFFNVSGVDAVHKGIELDFVWSALSSLEVNGFLSLGDWKWQNNVEAENPITGDPVSIFAQGLPTGNSAQNTAGLGMHYKGIRNTYIGARMRYAGKLYVQHDPADEFLATDAPNQLPDYAVLDIYFGRYFDLSEDLRGRISGNINNITNEEYVQWATQFFGTQKAYGFSTTYNIGLSLYF